MKKQRFQVHDLTTLGVERWFDIGPVPADRIAAMSRLKSLLVADETKQPFRHLALDRQGATRAKIGGYVTSNGCLTFWAVYHAEHETPSTRLELAQLLIESCVRRAAATPGVRFAETKPAFDTPDLGIFRAGLVAEGFSEVSQSHLYSCRPTALTVIPLPAGVERRPCRELAEERLAELFASAQAGTSDRAQRQELLSAQQTIEELRRWAGSVADTPLWAMALLDGQPVGYALCGLIDAPDKTAKEGFMIELGVVPQVRRRGIGGWLVRDVLRLMNDIGVSEVKALIDDENTPSRALHEKIGFKAEPGFYSIWRRRIRD